MPKIKLSIDPDIDFGLVVWAEAFGIETAFGIRKKKKRVKQGGTTSQISIELQDEDNSDDESEEDSE